MGYSDAAPYGAGREFTNADLLTPEGSHIIAHSDAMGMNDTMRVIRHLQGHPPCHFDPWENNPAKRLIRLNL